MNRLRILGLALVAVFAMSAVVASAASAAWVASPWEAFYSGSWHVVTTTIKVTSAGTLKLKNGGDEVECEGTNKGTIGAGGIDEVLTVTVKNPCKLIANSGCKSPQPSGFPKAAAIHLPWKTQLEDETNGEKRDKITAHTGGEAPGWSVECENILKGKSKVECTAAEELTKVTNESMSFLTTFAPTGEPASCKGGISSKGAVIGPVKFSVEAGQEIGGEKVEGVRAG